MAQKIEGKVVSVDQNGDLVTDITANQLTDVSRDERVFVSCDEHETMGIYGPDHGQPEMTLLAVINDAGYLKLSIVGESARLMLGIDVGEKVVVSWT